MDGRALENRTRRYDIDWLRIAAVLLLIPFHTARVFNVGEQFYAKNEQLSIALQRFIVFVQPWHMSLLFVLAGAASWFALGYRSGGRYAADRLKRLLVLGVAAMAARAALWPGMDDYPDPSWQDSVVNWLGYQLGLWMVIVGLMGLFHRYADRKGGAYAYATEAAYPFYILHQTVIVLIAYVVVQWGVGIPLKYTLIAATSFVLTLAVYEVAVRRWRVVRPLFGMKPKRRRTS